MGTASIRAGTTSPSIVTASRSDMAGAVTSVDSTSGGSPAMLPEDSISEPSEPISCANASSG